VNQADPQEAISIGRNDVIVVLQPVERRRRVIVVVMDDGNSQVPTSVTASSYVTYGDMVTEEAAGRLEGQDCCLSALHLGAFMGKMGITPR
jgi:hypothetical protein